MRLLLAACLLASSHVAPVWAQSSDLEAAAAAPITDETAIVVSGVQPGPGMWKVSKGDHVLWILGTLSPVPRDVTWLSRDVEAAIAQSQEVLQPPGLAVNADIGVFSGLMLLPSALKASKNPDGAMLKDVLPADLYARWSLLKAHYIGRDNGIEKKRPLLAANELYSAAIRKAGLSDRNIVAPVVNAAIKKHQVKTTPTHVKVTIKDPKAAIKEFAAEPLGDLDCFAKTLDRIENDLGTMRERANAWAIGDVEGLRNLPYIDQQGTCLSALSSTAAMQKRGMGDARARVQGNWLAAAEGALAKNPVTFATMPIGNLIEPDGYIATIKAKGYVVEEP